MASKCIKDLNNQVEKLKKELEMSKSNSISVPPRQSAHPQLDVRERVQECSVRVARLRNMMAGTECIGAQEEVTGSLHADKGGMYILCN